jgi:hypothetical protein
MHLVGFIIRIFFHVMNSLAVSALLHLQENINYRILCEVYAVCCNMFEDLCLLGPDLIFINSLLFKYSFLR